jgi:hypothetical protein
VDRPFTAFVGSSRSSSLFTTTNSSLSFFGVDANTTATLLCGDDFTGVLALGITLGAEGTIELELKLGPTKRACFDNLCCCGCDCWERDEGTAKPPIRGSSPLALSFS